MRSERKTRDEEGRARHDGTILVARAWASLLGLALLVSPRLLPPCDHQILTASGAAVPMRCHWTFQAELLLALGTLAVALVAWGARSRDALRLVGAVLVVQGLSSIAVTQSWVIGLCGHSEMACHRTAHWQWLWAVLLLLDGAFLFWRARADNSPVSAITDPWEETPKIEIAPR